jgi:3-deoxy-manno-octulosonate cytidylyltransferase (CMP-KDO synthetase)
MKTVIIIPARMKSTRLPGKPLVDILGKSLIQRTWEQCCKAFPSEKVYIATDDAEIEKHCNQIGMKVVMTSEHCLTGTDRVADAATQIGADYYINVQGDEPLINPQDIIDTVASIKQYPGAIINGYAEIVDPAMWDSVSVPKVVFRANGRLLYMSRAPIPGNKKKNFVKAWRQICVYAFPKTALVSFRGHEKKTPLEELEDIEILRFLELGYEVQMIKLSAASIAVDNPEDVEKVIKRLNENNS